MMNTPPPEASASSPKAKESALSEVACAAEAVRAAQRTVREANRDLSTAIFAAHDADATLKSIAEAAGIEITDVSHTLVKGRKRVA